VSAAAHPAFRRGPVRVFAHRGGAALAPENTIVAFDRGLALGADGLELDVRLSRDGVAVVLHDPTVDRTTNGTGAVADLSAAELAGLDAGYRFGASDGFPFRGRGIGVPRLREVLERYRGVPSIVELKVDEPELARQALADARAAGASAHVAIGSFTQRVLDAARALDAHVPTSASTDEVLRLLRRSWFGLTVRHPPYRLLQVPEIRAGRRIVSPRFVRAAHRAGLVVQVWTINREDDMRRLLGWGVDALISDRPDVAVKIVNEHGTDTERARKEHGN
jgi:glycerophosphoryl diester phosphodiesterase